MSLHRFIERLYLAFQFNQLAKSFHHIKSKRIECYKYKEAIIKELVATDLDGVRMEKTLAKIDRNKVGLDIIHFHIKGFGCVSFHTKQKLRGIKRGNGHTSKPTIQRIEKYLREESKHE